MKKIKRRSGISDRDYFQFCAGIGFAVLDMWSSAGVEDKRDICPLVFLTAVGEKVDFQLIGIDRGHALKLLKEAYPENYSYFIENIGKVPTDG